MPALAHRFEEPTFRESIANYVTVTCHRYRVRRVDVEDVVQEALTKIVARIATFRPEKGEFDAWARGVALNVIRRYLRRAKRHGARFSAYTSNADDYATHAPSPERCVQRKQAWCSISNAMGKLTAQQVNVLISFDVHDMSHKEIGTKLNIPEAASSQCHKRAHKRLARCLDRELLSVMPPFVTSCDEPITFHKNGSRWTERSHYTGQIVAAILAFLSYTPLNQAPQMHDLKTTETRVLGHVQNAVMYRSDERADVHDELRVLRDAPSGKPEPASLTSVRAVSTPAKRVDKLPPPPEYVPRLSPKHEPSTSDNRPNGL